MSARGRARRWGWAVLGALAAGGLSVSVLGAGADVDRRALRRIAEPPLGLPPVPVPAANPPTAAKVALGRKLFFDRRLSHNGTMSCGMCHIPEQGLTNNELATAVGTGGRSLPRNAPALYNVAYLEHLFHDGRETGLETQVVSPLLDHREMANPSIGYLIAKLERLPDYRGRFERAFGGGPDIRRVGEALASWERTLLSANSPFDRWYYGDERGALAPEAVAGFGLFSGKAGCAACHRVGQEHATFTDDAFHDTGIAHRAVAERRRRDPVAVEIAPGVTVPMSRAALASVSDPRAPDLGRYEVTLDPDDRWRFKTPSLRNVALTAPYMHDGSMQTLEAVVRFYSAGGFPHPEIDPLVRPLDLGEAGIAAIVAFLRSLTGDNVAELRADARSAPVGN